MLSHWNCQVYFFQQPPPFLIRPFSLKERRKGGGNITRKKLILYYSFSDPETGLFLCGIWKIRTLIVSFLSTHTKGKSAIWRVPSHIHIKMKNLGSWNGRNMNYDQKVRYGGLNYSHSTLSCAASRNQLILSTLCLEISLPNTTASLVTSCLPCCLPQQFNEIFCYYITLFIFFSHLYQFSCWPPPSTKVNDMYFQVLL